MLAWGVKEKADSADTTTLDLPQIRADDHTPILNTILASNRLLGVIYLREKNLW